jgi:hypothetical protein
MLAFFNLGLPELIILCGIGAVAVAVPVTVVVLVVVLNRQRDREPRSDPADPDAPQR